LFDFVNHHFNAESAVVRLDGTVRDPADADEGSGSNNSCQFILPHQANQTQFPSRSSIGKKE
jgi:hypothetical protein